MKNVQTLAVLLTIVALGSFPIFGESLESLTVSPGARDRVTGVEVRCPTFSWQAVPGAVGYEVVVYELPPRTELSAWSLDDTVEVLFVELPSGVTGWTPSLESGLARGADHVWFVRGVFGDAGLDDVVTTEWSVARFFRVAGAVTQAGTGLVTRERVGDSGTGSGSMGARSGTPEAAAGRSAMAKRVGEENTRDVGTAMAAIRGEMPDATGETYGVVGTSNSFDGAGLGAVNTAGGPDLVLDGVLNGQTDLDVYHWGIDRASPSVETFVMTNSVAGELNLLVNGDAQAHSFTGGGMGLFGVNAETLDGVDSTGFSPSVHLHDNRYYTETELNASGAGGSVHWDNLGNAPAGFADGVDNDTTYGAGTGLDLAGTVFSSMGSGYEHMVVVATDGGDFDDIQTAIDSISGASAEQPVLVWVGPGVFNGPVTLKPHVHLKGAGREVTSIVSSINSGAWPPTTSTLNLSSNASVSDLSVSNVGDGPTVGNVVAMLAPDGTTSSLVADVNVTAHDTGGYILAVVVMGGDTVATFENVAVLATGGSSNAVGLRIADGATLTLFGGSYVGRGGTGGKGIHIDGVGSSLNATNANVIGEDGSSLNRALWNVDGAAVTVYGGTFVARGGIAPIGILNAESGTSFDGTNVTAIAEEGVNSTQGLRNQDGPVTTLRGGSFVARSGQYARGIMNSIDGTLVATGVTAVGEGGTDTNNGLYGGIGSSTILRDGSFSAVGGANAYGIELGFGVTLFEAVFVTAAGEGGSTESLGLLQITGPVLLGASQLKGGVNLLDPSTVTCYHVFDENFGNYNCVPVSE